MRILMPGTYWQGEFLENICNAFKKEENEVEIIYFPQNKHILKSLKLTHIDYFLSKVNNDLYNSYNSAVLKKISQYKPNIVLTFSTGARLYPETLQKIRNNKIITVTLIGDNPFDSSRDKYFPMALQYYDYIFVGEKIWIDNIKKVAPNSKIFKVLGGYNQNLFFPISIDTIKKEDYNYYSCDVSFTGSNYGDKAEGAYRAGILNQLYEFDVRIWGYGNWPFRFNYYPNLKSMYKGNSLTWNNLRKLYTLSKINLNMPSPQIYTSFQPRLFDIAATKGFQIIDYREELDDYFADNELVTFKSIPELKDKIRYYLNNPNERNLIVEKLYKKVVNKFTWENQIKEIIQLING